MKTILSICALFLLRIYLFGTSRFNENTNGFNQKKKRTYIVSNSDTTYIKPEVAVYLLLTVLVGWRDFFKSAISDIPAEQYGLVLKPHLLYSSSLYVQMERFADIEAVSGPEDLRESAVAALKKNSQLDTRRSGWKNVRSYKKQPIVYRLPK